MSTAASGDPGPDAEPTVAALRQIWASIAEVCADLDPTEWDLATECPGWTVRDQVSHMIGTERMLLGEEGPSLEGPLPSYVRNPIGESNEAWVAERRSRTGAEVLDEFRRVTAERLAQLRSFGPDRFGEVGWSPVGQVPYREFMDVRAFDCWVHEQDIRRAVGRPGGRGGEGEARSVERVANLLGYIVGRRVAPPEGTVVRWDVTGPLGRTVTVTVRQGRGEVGSDGGAVPDVRLALDTEWFVRLGCGRVGADEARAAGAVAIEGDAALGERVLGEMGVTI